MRHLYQLNIGTGAPPLRRERDIAGVRARGHLARQDPPLVALRHGGHDRVDVLAVEEERNDAGRKTLELAGAAAELVHHALDHLGVQRHRVSRG
jgi:hypothetical protein